MGRAVTACHASHTGGAGAARESVLNQITQIVNRAPEIGSNVDTLD